MLGVSYSAELSRLIIFVDCVSTTELSKEIRDGGKSRARKLESLIWMSLSLAKFGRSNNVDSGQVSQTLTPEIDLFNECFQMNPI